MLKALINVRVYDYENYYPNGYIIFDEIIHEAGDMKNFKNNFYRVIDGKGKLVLPNFVCAHSHIYSIFARGLSLPFNPTNFQEILDQMWWKLDRQIDNKITYYSGIAASYEFLLNGVTTIIDHHASGDEILGSLKYLNKSVNDVTGLRNILCFETSDRFDVDKCIKENMNFALKNQTAHSSGLFGMHASMSLKDKSLQKISKKAAGLPIHIHVAESDMDEVDCYEKYKTSIIERLDKYELIAPDSLIVHGVFLNEKEIEIIKERDAYIVVNPTSNMNNAVGITDINAFFNADVKVMVGNDGLSSSMATEYLNAYYLTHLKNYSPTVLGLDAIRKMILNSYDYVSKRLQTKIGKFLYGYVADFMIIDYKPFTDMNSKNAFGHLFFGLFPNFKPINVYVDGNLLVKNGEVTSKKLKKEFEESKKYSEMLWKRVNK